MSEPGETCRCKRGPPQTGTADRLCQPIVQYGENFSVLLLFDLFLVFPLTKFKGLGSLGDESVKVRILRHKTGLRGLEGGPAEQIENI